MPDGEDLDEVVKSANKLIDDWGKDLAKIVAELKKMDGGKGADDKKGDDKKGGDKKGGDKDQKKAQKKAEEDADDASKELQKKILDLKIPPTTDPKQALKLPDILTKNIGKYGLKVGDYGSVKPDIDIDTKKMKLKKFELTWTWEW